MKREEHEEREYVVLATISGSAMIKATSIEDARTKAENLILSDFVVEELEDTELDLPIDPNEERPRYSSKRCEGIEDLK